MMVYLAVILALFITYCTWRWIIYRKALKYYEPLFPPRHRLTWKACQPVPTPSLTDPAIPEELEAGDNGLFEDATLPLSEPWRPAERDEQLDYLTAAADGLLQGLPVFDAFQQIDTAVLNAIEFSTRAELSNLASIADYVDARFFDAPAETAEGWFHRLVGYVGEQKAAAALESMGHHVGFAHTPNQEGWDLLVDGEPFNVKVGEFAAREGKEFLAFPRPTISLDTDLR